MRSRRSALRAWLVLVSLSGTACAGQLATPMVQVPLLRRAGQGEAGLVVGPGSRRPELGGTLRFAATDTLRVGGSFLGSAQSSGSRTPRTLRESRGSAPRIFADGFLGAEWGGLVMRYGALAGAGYGLRAPVTSRCAVRADGVLPCEQPARARDDVHYVRSYGQLHLALSPPGPFALSLAVRVPVTVELARAGAGRFTEVTSEVALTHTLRLRYVRLDLQPLWSRAQGFAFHLAFLLRFETGAWPPPP